MAHFFGDAEVCGAAPAGQGREQYSWRRCYACRTTCTPLFEQTLIAGCARGIACARTAPPTPQRWPAWTPPPTRSHRFMDERNELEIHAKDARNQVQWQKDGGERRERAHDVVGAVALHRKGASAPVSVLLQPAARGAPRVQCVPAHRGCVALSRSSSRGRRGVGQGPGFQRVDPVLNGTALVFADFIQVVQRRTGIEQRTPVHKPGARLGAARSASGRAAGSGPAAVQVAVHHGVDQRAASGQPG